jgi:hypothetical protein
LEAWRCCWLSAVLHRESARWQSRHRHHYEAIGVALGPKLTTESSRRFHVGNWSDAQAIPNTFRAKIGLLHHGPVGGEKRWIFVSNLCEKCQGLSLALLRTDLHHILAWRCGDGLPWWCRADAGTGPSSRPLATANQRRTYRVTILPPRSLPPPRRPVGLYQPAPRPTATTSKMSEGKAKGQGDPCQGADPRPIVFIEP